MPASNPILSIGIWNTQWSTSNSKRGKIIADVLLAQGPDVVCITEGQTDFLSAEMQTCFSTADHGYFRKNSKDRKVILFSRNPWREVDTIGDPDLPPGRFVAGTTDTPLGPIRFVAVCIPWHAAHVASGSRDRVLWQDHRAYLNGLRNIIDELPDDSIVLGDFNQRLPRQGQPKDLEELLVSAFGKRLTVVTSGIIPGIDEHSIDHLACGPSFSLNTLKGLPKTENGFLLSDHFGLVVSIGRR